MKAEVTGEGRGLGHFLPGTESLNFASILCLASRGSSRRSAGGCPLMAVRSSESVQVEGLNRSLPGQSPSGSEGVTMAVLRG